MAFANVRFGRSPPDALVLTDVSPSPRVAFGAPDAALAIRIAPFIKGDPGITGLSYVNIVDANGVVLASLLTGAIQ